MRPTAVVLLLLVACLWTASLAFAEDHDRTGDDDDSGDDDESPSSVQLPAEEVREKRPAARDDTADAVEVSGDRLRDSTRASVLEAVSQEAADVYVTGRGVGLHGVSSGASGAIMVRGLGGSPNAQVLVVEDGVPDIQGIFGHPIPDAYVPFLIEDARVIRGGDSVLYGTNALGGVIALRSRWLHDAGYELASDTAYGSYNTLREQAGFLGRFGDWDTAAAFTFLTSEGHRDGAGGTNVIGQTGVRWRAADGLSIALRNKVLHLKGEDPGPASHPNTDHWYDVWRDNASLDLRLERPLYSLRATPYVNVGIHRLYDGFRSVDTTSGGSVEADVVLPASLGLIAGLSIDAVDGKVEDRIADESEPVTGNQSYAAYGQASWRPLRRLLFVAGARELYSSEYEWIFLYKGGVRWNFWGPLTFHARVAKNFRQPTLRELYLPYPTANPDLKPETSLNADAGFELETTYVQVETAGYRTSARNLIKYFGVWPSAEVVNIDHLTVYGIEGRLVLRNLGPVRISAAGDFQDIGVRYTRQNPREKYNFGVEVNQPLGVHFVGGSVSAEWVRGLFMNNYKRDAIPDVFFMDASLRYRYVDPRGIAVEPYLIVRNILDSDYEYIEDYPMPGTHFLAGLKVTL